MDGSNNNNPFANMFSQGFPVGFNPSDFQQPAPAPAVSNNNMSVPIDASLQVIAPAPTGTNANNNDGFSSNPSNGLNMNNFSGINFSQAGLNPANLVSIMNTAEVMNALQQQQPQAQLQQQQNQQQQQSQLQQPQLQQASAMINAFSNMPGMAGMTNTFAAAAGMQPQQMSVQAGSAFPQNMGGMFNQNMTNAMGIGNMGGMNIQGLQNVMSQLAAAPQSATNGSNNEVDELRRRLGMSQQVQAPAQATAQAPVQAPPAQAQPNPQQALAQLFQNSGTAQGFNPMMMMFGGTAMCQNPLAAAQLSAFGVNPLTFQNASSMLAQGANNHTNGTPNPVSSNSNSATASTSGVVPPASISLTAPASLFSAQANSLAALGALDASGLITSSEDLENATAKGKKSKKKVKGKPKRPLSAYNLFFKDERERILKSIPGSEKKNKKKSKGGQDKDKDGKSEDDKDKDKPAKSEDDTESKGESNVKDFDQMDKNGKKIPHGKIGFENLAKLIGKRWQELEPEHVEKYKKLADKDMKRYKEEMEVFLTREARAGLEDDSLGTPLFYNTKDDSEDETKDKKRKSSGDVDQEGKKKVKLEKE